MSKPAVPPNGASVRWPYGPVPDQAPRRSGDGGTHEYDGRGARGPHQAEDRNKTSNEPRRCRAGTRWRLIVPRLMASPHRHDRPEGRETRAASVEVCDACDPVRPTAGPEAVRRGARPASAREGSDGLVRRAHGEAATLTDAERSRSSS